MKSLTQLLLLTTLGNCHAGDGPKSGLPMARSVSTSWSLQSLSLGPAWRSLGSLDYRGRSFSRNFVIPSVVGSDALNLPPIGNPGTIGNRTYNDGFVFLDGTGSTDGDTWFWGYDSAGQVSGNDLLFSATGSRSDFSQRTLFAGERNSDETLDALSFQADLVLAPPPSLDLPFDGLLISFWTFSQDRSSRFSNFSGSQQRNDYRLEFVDRYDIAPIQPVIGAPYAGSSGGPGPVISNLPLDRRETEVLMGGDSALFSNSIATSLDLQGYSLAVGPTWQGRLGSRWSWQASAGVTFNLFQWQARETETLQYSLNGAAPVDMERWRDSKSGSDFQFGLYAKGEILRQLTESLFAKAYLQLEMADSVEIEVKGSTYEFTPQGYALGLGLGYHF